MTQPLGSERSGSALRILSWNVNGLDTSRLDSRIERLCTEIVLGVDLSDALAGEVRPMPEVVCLQEVVRRAHLAKIGPHLRAAGFALHPETPSRDDGDYLLLAVRPPWRIDEVASHLFEDSPLGRAWLEATIVHPTGARARVLTAHMESLRSGSGSRVAQCIELDSRMRASAEPCVFAGDTNLRDEEWSRARDRGVAMMDAFELAGAPRAHRHTWWPERKGRGFRFDRVWLDESSAWTVELGTRRRPSLSDHAAIEALLSF